MGNCKCCETQTKNNELVIETNNRIPIITPPSSTKNKQPVQTFQDRKNVINQPYERLNESIHENNNVIKYISTPLIFDNGNLNTRIGLADKETPYFTFPTIVGNSHSEMNHNKFIGSDAINNKAELLNFVSPLNRGVIINWDEMEAIWDYSFNLLNSANLDDCRCVLTELVDNPSQNRMKTCEYFMEKFLVSKFLLINQSVLSMYNSAKTSGVLVDSGHSSSYIVPIYEGYTLRSNMNKLKLSGVDIHEYLTTLLNQISRKFTTKKSKELVYEIIKNHCYYSLNYEDEITKNSKSKKIMFPLPDGEQLELGDELFQCTEILFNPKIMGVKDDPIPIQLVKTLENIDLELRSFMSQNIDFTGGSTLLKGFVERMKKEVSKVFGVKKVVMSYKEKNINSAWIGGSLVANLSSFQNDYVNKQEFDECGPHIIQRKCFY